MTHSSPSVVQSLAPAGEISGNQVPLFMNQMRHRSLEEAGKAYNKEYQRPMKYGIPIPRVVPLSNQQKFSRAEAQNLAEAQLGAPRKAQHAEQQKELQRHAREKYSNHEQPLNRHLANTGNFQAPLEERMRPYENKHEEQVIQSMRERNADKLKREILPQLRAQYSGYGKRSGSADAAIAKALLDMEKHERGQEAELRSSNFQFGSKMAEEQAKREQEGMFKNVGLGHNIHHAESERQLLSHRMMRDADTQEMQNKMKSLELNNLMGALGTAHSQEERNADMKDFAEENNYSWDQLQKLIEIMSGAPQGSSISTRFSQPAPNTYNSNAAISSLMGQIGAAQMMGGRAGAKEGGEIKGYAKGGSVSHTPRLPASMGKYELSQDNLHAPEPNPFLEKMEEMAVKTENKQAQPYLPLMLYHAFGNMMNEEDPRIGFVKGAKIGLDKHMDSKEKSAENEMQALNLRAKIFDTLREERRHNREQTRLEKESKIKSAREGREQEFEHKKLALENRKIDLLSGKISSSHEEKLRKEEKEARDKADERKHRHNESDFFSRQKEHKKAVGKRYWTNSADRDEDAKQEFIENLYETQNIPAREAERLWEAQKDSESSKPTPAEAREILAHWGE